MGQPSIVRCGHEKMLYFLPEVYSPLDCLFFMILSTFLFPSKWPFLSKEIHTYALRVKLKPAL